MQKYFGTQIANILYRINRDIFIPSIQRPFVWDPEDILKLFDSLLRGYPINTFLLWELQPESFGDWKVYRFVSDFQHGSTHNDIAQLSPGQNATLVLDGQQRLTSLLIGLSGSYIVRNGLRGKGAAWVTKLLMLNLLQAPEVTGEDGEVTVTRELYYGLKFFNSERLPKNDREAIWFKVADIASIVNRLQLEETFTKLLLLNPDLTVDAKRQLKRNLTRLWLIVHEEECIAYYLEREQSSDKVLDIFIRTNDGGTKLGHSDIFMSMVTMSWKRLNARDEMEAVTSVMREVLQQDTGLDRDYLLRSGLFFNEANFAFQLKNFTLNKIALIEQTWQLIRRALIISAQMFAKFQITGAALTGTNALMLIALFVYKSNCGKPVDEWVVYAEDEERIRLWVTSVLFHNVLGGTANVTMESYRRLINERLRQSPEFPMAELTARMMIRGRSMSYDDQAVGRFVSQDQKSRLFRICLFLLYPRTDWSAKNWNVVQVIPSAQLTEEKLRVKGVPNESVPDYEEWAPCLINYVVLSDLEKDQYLRINDSEEWARSRSQDFLERHHLPGDPALYDTFCFMRFVETRKYLLAQHLRKLLQNANESGVDMKQATLLNVE